MSRHLRIAAGLAAAVAVLVVLARWFGGPDAFALATATDRAADGGAGPLQEVLAATTNQSAVDGSGGESDQSGFGHSRAALDADPSRIEIRLRDREMLPARGVVTCASSWKPPSALPPLDGNHLRTVAEQGSSGPSRIVELGDVLGEVGFERPAAAFTWLRIDSRACGGPVFARVGPAVGPAAGPVELEVVLPPLRHRVHIQALRADLLGIAPGASLQCADSKGRVVWQGRADAAGYGIAELPGAGDYVVRAAGASHLDGDQVRVRLSAVPHDATAVVAMPEERHRVDVVVSAVFDEQATLLPTLLLRRIDPGRSVVACVTASLRRGLSRHQVEVPAGDSSRSYWMASAKCCWIHVVLPVPRAPSKKNEASGAGRRRGNIVGGFTGRTPTMCTRIPGSDAYRDRTRQPGHLSIAALARRPMCGSPGAVERQRLLLSPMFTGLVTGIGTVAASRAVEGGHELEVELRGLPAPPRVGDSIALSGVCCTVVECHADRAKFFLSPETLARTWLGRSVTGDRLNLEGALRAGDPLGGHLVQGHVDGEGRVTLAIDPVGGGDLGVEVPANLRRYCVEKGSITLDGVSLTIAGIAGSVVRIAVIPHTAQVTTLGRKRVGDPLHIEVDVLAKYVEQMLAARGLC